MTQFVATAQDRPKGRVRFGIWIVMFLAFFVAYLDRTNVTILIANEGYTTTLGIAGDKGTQGLLMTVFLFFYGVASFFIGPVIDRIGPRRVLIYNLVLWAGIMIIMGSVASFQVHLGCRGLLGLSEAMAAPVCSKLIHTWFPVQERAKANGVWFIGLNLSLLVGMPLVAWFVATLGWADSFYAIAALNIIPVFVCVALVYDTVASHPRISKEEADYITAGAVEHHTAVTTSYKFLSKPLFWTATLIYAVNLAAFWGLMAWLPSYLRAAHGISLVRTGWLAAIPYVLNCLFLIIFTPLMDKYNVRSPVTAAGCCTLTASMIIVALTGDYNIALVFISLAFGCITIANCSLFPILQNGLEANEVATAIGMFTGIAYVFSSAFPYVMGWMYSATGTMTAAFYLLVGTVVFGALATIPMVQKKL